FSTHLTPTPSAAPHRRSQHCFHIDPYSSSLMGQSQQRSPLFPYTTLFRSGSTATRCAPPSFVRGRDSGLSRRSASKMCSDFSGSHFRVEPTPATRCPILPMGTVVNSDEEGEKFRIARPRSSSSSVPKPLSARTEPSTARVTS